MLCSPLPLGAWFCLAHLPIKLRPQSSPSGPTIGGPHEVSVLWRGFSTTGEGLLDMQGRQTHQQCLGLWSHSVLGFVRQASPAGNIQAVPEQKPNTLLSSSMSFTLYLRHVLEPRDSQQSQLQGHREKTLASSGQNQVQSPI